MPLYEYTCSKCKTFFEALVRKKKDETELSCPKCGTREINKELSAFATSGTEKKVSNASSSCNSCSSGSCSSCH